MPGSSVLAASPTALRLPRSEEAGKNGVGGHAIAAGGGSLGLRRETASGETSNYFQRRGW